MEEELTAFEDEGGEITAGENEITEAWYGDTTGDITAAGADQPEVGETDADDKKPEEIMEANQSFRLKYLGQEFDVSRDEVIALAQKGKDYDRIRSREKDLMEAAAKNGEYAGFLQELAGSEGLGPEEFIDRKRASILMRNNGIDEKTALAQVRLDRREKQVSEREAGLGAAYGPDGAEEKKRRDVREFVAEYGTINPESIPQEVWEGVAGGKTLLAAYQGYENRQLKARLEAEKKNAENREKSTGPRGNSGKTPQRGEIEEDWYRED